MNEKLASKKTFLFIWHHSHGEDRGSSNTKEGCRIIALNRVFPHIEDKLVKENVAAFAKKGLYEDALEEWENYQTECESGEYIEIESLDCEENPTINF